jgi:hypothetical protein
LTNAHVEGPNPARVNQSDTVRIKGRGIAGAQITAKVNGAGNLDATNDVRTILNGNPLIGAELKEFMVKPTGKGKIAIAVTIQNPTGGKRIVNNYEIIVQ